MVSSPSIGRIGGLAVALGIGTAIAGAGCAAAWADSGEAAEKVTRSASPSPSAPIGGPRKTAARTAGSDGATADVDRARRAPRAVQAARASTAVIQAPSAQSQPAAPQAEAAPTGTARAAVTANGVTVNPTVTFADGVVQGVLNATSDRYLDTSCSTTQKSSCLKYEYVPTDRTVREFDIGKVTFASQASTADPQDFSVLPYLTWNLDTGVGKGTQTFEVRVTEVTDFGAFVTGLPLIGLLAEPVITLLQRTPFVDSLLAPIIGASVVAEIDVALDALAPGATPVAFTYKVTSFDGVKISTNFFPAAEIESGETSPLVLNGPGLGAAGGTDPFPSPPGPDSQSYLPPLAVLRAADYNVITWDPRGEHASGGLLQLDNPFYEGRDVSAIVSWAADNPLVELDSAGDPAVGMVGGSYGGAIQLNTASTDPRIDAIVPGITWHSLNSSLYPEDVFKSAWMSVLGLALVATGARINNQIYTAAATGFLFGFISESAQALLGSSGPTSLLNQLKAPTLLLQGTADALFPLAQAVANAETILANPWGTETKMVWFCGGHGYCLDPVNPSQASRLYVDTIAWLDTYVAGIGDPAADIPAFQWYDQRGGYHTSDLLPFEPGFNLAEPYTASGAGGVLPIIPVIGGSGPIQGPDTLPSVLLAFPINGVFGTEAANAVNVAVTPAEGSQIVGAPQLSFSYSGIGTGKAVFAQLVDDATGQVVGSIVSAIPVSLNGQTNTVSIPMQDIAYTVGAGDSLTLQIVAYSSLFANASLGVIDISDVRLDLPLRDQGTLF